MSRMLTLVLSLAIVAAAHAGDRSGEGQIKLKFERQPAKLQSGSSVARAVTRTTERIKWQDSLADARRVAQEKGKMVLFMQLVGDLDGGL